MNHPVLYRKPQMDGSYCMEAELSHILSLGYHKPPKNLPPLFVLFEQREEQSIVGSAEFPPFHMPCPNMH